jgi:hypothetical protein
MKKLINKLMIRARNAIRCIVAAVLVFTADPRAFTKKALTGRAGEGYIDTAIKILVAVVLGALLLGGLYALFGDVVMPTLKERIQNMFDYGG